MEARLHLHKYPKKTQYGEEPAPIKSLALGLSLDFISSNEQHDEGGTVASVLRLLKKNCEQKITEYT